MLVISDDDKRREFWKQHIVKCMNSNMPVEKYCEKNRISRRQYYYWKKKFTSDGNVDLDKEAKEYNKGTFVKLDMEELKASEESENSNCEISASIYCSSAKIDIYKNADTETVKAVLEEVFKYAE